MPLVDALYHERSLFELGEYSRVFAFLHMVALAFFLIFKYHSIND